MARKANSLFNYAQILSVSKADNGTFLLQTGDVFDPNSTSEKTEFWSPIGYVSKPAKANPNKDAAEALCISEGNHDVCFATRDVRANSLIDPLDYGEVQLFAGGPNNSGISKIVLNNDGSNQKVTITVGTTKIEVNSSGTVNITGQNVNLSSASDFAALSAKVDANFSALKTAISAGMAAGSPFVWTAPPTPSVAASNVKIS